MIQAQFRTPSSILIALNPYVSTEEARRLIEAVVSVKSQVSTVQPVARSPTQQDPAWLTDAYALGRNAEASETVFTMMSDINERLYAGDTDDVNDILGRLREGDLPIAVSLGLLRFCARTKSKLNHWDELKDRVIAEAGRRGRNTPIGFTD